MTPGEYKRTMLRLLKEKEPAQRVIDLFVVPDYEEAFKSCVGTFKRWAKVIYFSDYCARSYVVPATTVAVAATVTAPSHRALQRQQL
jgi:hypothetical protein